MPYRAVCISPTDGSAGELVGPVVARELGFQLLNEEIVERAAEEAGVNAAAVADAERRKTLTARVLAVLTETGPAGASGYPGLLAQDSTPSPGRDELRDFIRAVIWEAGERGEAVIVAHAASFALAKRSDVLRVWISASPETRARRVAEARSISEAEAAKVIARGDSSRADYLKLFYGISAELPTHYDIALNTDHVGVEEAAALISSVARSQPVPA